MKAHRFNLSGLGKEYKHAGIVFSFHGWLLLLALLGMQLLIQLPGIANATTVNVLASPVEGTFYFLEALREVPGYSPIFRKYFVACRGEQTGDRKFLETYKSIVSAHSNDETGNALHACAIGAANSQEFLNRAEKTLGLSKSEGKKFRESFLYFEPLYRSLIWQPNLATLSKQTLKLQSYLNAHDTFANIAKLKRFLASGNLPSATSL